MGLSPFMCHKETDKIKVGGHFFPELVVLIVMTG
jgi:hypothetical protein